MLGVFAGFVVLYLADLFSRGFLSNHLILYPREVLSHPWQVVTTALVHFKVSQLLQTMLGLWFFGVPVENQLGRQRTLVTMFGAATLGSLAVAIVGQFFWSGPYAAYDATSMAMLGAFGVAYAQVPLSFFGVMQIRSTTLAGIFVAIRLISDLERADYYGVIGGLVTAVSAALLSGYASRLGPLLRGYRDKIRKAKQRKGFVVIDGGKRPNEPRFWN